MTPSTLSKAFVAAVSVTLLLGVPSAYAQRHGGGGHRAGGGGGHGGHSNRAAPRTGGAPRAGGGYRSQGFVRGARPHSYGYGVRRGYYGFGASPYRFYRPYYAFRPRISLGFGLWVGFPIAYPYYDDGFYDPYYYRGYGYPYPYPYSSPAYGSPYPPPDPGYSPRSTDPDPQSGSVQVEPDQTDADQADNGGVSFEITPSTAEVFVDGAFVGTTGEFTPLTGPLDLTPGRHRIEIRAPGYSTMGLGVDIVAGQVIPYQGTLQR